MIEHVDHCAGGHPPVSIHRSELTGLTWCGRCGRAVDMSRCRHGLAVGLCNEPHDIIKDALRIAAGGREAWPAVAARHPEADATFAAQMAVITANERAAFKAVWGTDRID